MGTSKKRQEKSETMTRIKPSSSSTVSAFFFFFVFFVLSSFCSSVLAEAFADENGEEKNRPLRRAQRPVSGVVDRRGGIFTRRKGRRGKGGFKDTHETVREPEHGFVLAERDEGANTRNRGQFLLPEMWVEYALPGGCVQRRFGERAVRFASAEFTDAVAVRIDLPTGTRDERRVPETCGVSTYTRFGNMHVSYFFFFGNRGRKGRTGDVEDCGVIDKGKKRHTTALFASEKSSIVVFLLYM